MDAHDREKSVSAASQFRMRPAEKQVKTGCNTCYVTIEDIKPASSKTSPDLDNQETGLRAAVRTRVHQET